MANDRTMSLHPSSKYISDAKLPAVYQLEREKTTTFKKLDKDNPVYHFNVMLITPMEDMWEENSEGHIKAKVS